MGFADLRGRARLDPQHPEGFGVCDDCGFWFNRVDLQKQFEYSGRALFWTGLYKCRTCLDKAQAQFLNPILPGDPRPIREPRPELPTTSFIAPGFTLFELDLDPGDAASVLASVATLSGVPTPAGATAPQNALVTFTQAMQRQQILAGNNQRTWFFVYNPSGSPVIVSTGQAAFSGDPKAIVLGAGQAMFGNAPIYQGALTAIGYFAGNPLLVFEAPGIGGGPTVPVVFP